MGRYVSGEVGRIHSDRETLGIWLYSKGGEVYTKQRPTLDIKSEILGMEPRTQSYTLWRI